MVAEPTTIQLDPELKREATALLDDFGLSLSGAITVFLRQVVREQAIPFRIGHSIYNAETLRAIQEARQGIGLSRGYDNMDDLLEALNSDEADDEV